MAKKNGPDIADYSSKDTSSGVGRKTERSEDIIESLTDYFCEHITESLEAVEKIIERRIIARVLQKTAGNKSRAAKLLGINRCTLNYKIKKLKIRVH